MTSEGQHAGQPAEATSGGGGTEPTTRGSAYGTPRVAGGYPDPDDQPPSGPSAAPQAAPQTGWGPDAYPNSYGPPPYPAAGSGSPFVVPAVPVFGNPDDFGSPDGEAQSPGQPAARPAPATFRSTAQVPTHTGDGTDAPAAWSPEQSREPQGQEPFGRPAEQHPYRAEPHPYRVTAAVDERQQAPATAPDADHPYRDAADDHPYRTAAPAAGSASVAGSSSVAGSPSVAGSASVPLATGRDDHAAATGSSAADSQLLPGGPLPSRADRPAFGGPDGPGNPDSMSGFNGFVSSAPGRRATGPAEPDQDGGSRPPGISAFGGQRVRVPGAALSGLSDAPPAGQSRPSNSGGFHMRGSGDAAPAADSHGPSGLPQPRTPADQPPTPAGDSHPAPSSPAHPGHVPSGPVPSGQVQPGQVQPGQAQSGQTASSQVLSGTVPSGPAQAENGPGQNGPGWSAPGAAVGSARPVTASASVPGASRVPPPGDAEDVPVSGGAAPRARVYGRAAPSDDQDSADGPDGPRFDEDAHPYRDSGNGQSPAGSAYPPPTGRASASARVTPPSGGTAGFNPGSPPPSYPPPAAPPAFPGSAGSFAPAGPSAYSPAGPTFPSGESASGDSAPFARGNPTSFASGPRADGADAQIAKPYSEHTTDVSRRGRSEAPQAEHSGPAPSTFPTAPFSDDPFRAGPHGNGNGAAPYSEHTTDVSRRGSAPNPYAATMPSMADNRSDLDGFAPTDPHRRMERPPSTGVFSEPMRATVTPPDQAETTSWAPPAQGAEQSRFDAFRPDEHTGPAAVPALEPAPGPAADKPEVTNVRMLPVLLGVILAAALLVGMAIGIVWLIARPGDSAFDVNAGECVKRNGDKAVTATCGDAGSFTVVSKVDAKEQCADPGQPYVLNPAGDGRSQVLCLKPN